MVASFFYYHIFLVLVLLAEFLSTATAQSDKLDSESPLTPSLIPTDNNNNGGTSTNNNSITIEYEYQLEINHGTNARNTNNQSIQQILQSKIDNDLLKSLQTMLPHGGITAASPSVDLVPNVRFSNLESTLFMDCFTSSDECGLVRTKLIIDYNDIKPEYSLERVGYQLVQEYLQNITDNSQGRILITYLYPYWVSNAIQLQMRPIQQTMSEMEVSVVAESTLQVVGATVAAMEGDTEILNVQFIYQDLIDAKRDDDENADVVGATNNSSDTTTLANTFNRALQADFQIHGICRQCNDRDFAAIVNKVVPNQLNALRMRLQRNGRFDNITYFDDLVELSFGLPQPPDDLPTTDHPDLYDTTVPTTDSYLPVFFFLGISMTVCILVTGMFFIWKDIQDDYDDDDKVDEYEKGGGFSTASESALEDDEDVTADGAAPHPNRRPLDPVSVEEYDIHDPTSVATDRISLNEYQVETVLSNEVMEDGRQSRPYNTVPSRHRRGHQSFVRDGRIPITSRQPKGARRTSATVSPATGRPYNSYAYSA
ncbi:hypothetical protein IV203_010717 [Nitzschia inconspicua]|uniref:Uncharacterized protein n=1 Tax=Nitzschia inconspicua TaxID=303405 RepID=A0A9K3PL23_9STRA|nr:hypothetical protein IV203_010717 [Nitzschia inconspicua]